VSAVRTRIHLATESAIGSGMDEWYLIRDCSVIDDRWKRKHEINRQRSMGKCDERKEVTQLEKDFMEEGK
jgi:hypothetical protein